MCNIIYVFCVSWRRWITEYGKRVISKSNGDKYDSKDQRWFRYLTRRGKDGYILDGNPDVNGGYQALGRDHCVAALANHSTKHQNAKLKQSFWRSPCLFFEDGAYPCEESCFLQALKNIRKHEQILISYEHLRGHEGCGIISFVP